MIPNSPLNDLVSVAKAMLGDSYTEPSNFDSTGPDMTSQVQHSNYQVTQPNYWNQGENYNNDTSYDELMLSIADELLTSSFTPVQSSNSSSIDTQLLDDDVTEEFALSMIEDLPLSLLSTLQRSHRADATTNIFENCVDPSTTLPELNLPSNLDNFSVMHNTQFDLHRPYNQPNLQQTRMITTNCNNSLSQPMCTSTTSQFHETQSSTQNFVPAAATPNEYLLEHNTVLTASLGINSKGTIDSFTCVPSPVEQNIQPPSASSYSSQNSQSDIFTFDTEVPQTSQYLRNRSLVEGGNKTKTPAVKLQHVCPMSDCNKVFVHAPSLIRHLNWHNGKKNFVCEHCNKKFTRKDNFTAHLKVQCSNNQQKSTRCQCPNCSADGGNNTRDSKGNLLHVCHHTGCKKSFNRIVLLDEHLRRHSGEKPYVCTWDSCRKSFVRKSDLLAHIKFHKNSKSTESSVDSDDKSEKLEYTCNMPDCGKVFSLFCNLKRHLPTHNGRKDVICAHCGKAFTRKEHLEKHMQKHTVAEQNRFLVKQQFICRVTECGKIYDCTKDLNAHLKSQHGILHPYVCATCNKKFERKNDFQRHMETHTTEKKFVCPQCGKRFRRSQHLDKHVRTIHNETKRKGKKGVPSKGRVSLMNSKPTDSSKSFMLSANMRLTPDDDNPFCASSKAASSTCQIQAVKEELQVQNICLRSSGRVKSCKSSKRRVMDTSS